MQRSPLTPRKSITINGWVGGVIQASRDRIYGTAQYYAVKMYGDYLGTDRLQSQVSSPELGPNIEALDALATSQRGWVAAFHQDV